MQIYLRIIIVLIGLSLSICNVEAENQIEEFPEIYKVSCVQNIHGCNCKETDQLLYHAESVELINKQSNDLFKVKSKRGTCTYRSDRLQKMDYYPINESPAQNKNHIPLSFNKLVSTQYKTDSIKKHTAGKVWATYYHLALEDFHPGKKVPVRNRAGKVIAHTSQSFLDQVRWEGSGIASDGTRIRWSGHGNRFDTYKPEWGWGAGYGYQVFPYRTIAVNFQGICNALRKSGKPVKGPCGKKQIIGRMVFIPEIANRKIPMQGGQPHDGFFCITDTGSPNYIKSDRIDIFVGLHGGGNPFLPPGRRSNHLIEGGIENLVPSDWRLWTSNRNRVWCDDKDLPSNGGQCKHDYHTVARHKALTLQLLFDNSGKPILCNKNP